MLKFCSLSGPAVPLKTWKLCHISLRFEAIFSHSFLIIIYFKCITFQQKSYRMDTCIRPRSHLLPWISSMTPSSWPPATGYPSASPTRQFCSCPCGSTAWGCSTQGMLAPFPTYKLGPPTHWEYGSVTQSVLLEEQVLGDVYIYTHIYVLDCHNEA